MSGVIVDKHAITRKVVGERRGHESGVGRRVMGIGSFTSSTATSRAPSVLQAPGHSSRSVVDAANQIAAAHMAIVAQAMIRHLTGYITNLSTSLKDQFPNFKLPKQPFRLPQHDEESNENDKDATNLEDM